MIAALPMYDRRENAAAHDALWSAIRDAMRARGLAAPEALNRGIGIAESWAAPDLVLGQTCGLPYRARLHGSVELVATFDYGLDDTAPGFYRSVFVTRKAEAGGLADFASRRFAYNQPESHSGWAAPQITAQAMGFRFDPSLETGGHRASALAVAEGRADIAALDAVTWRGIARWEPELARTLRVLDHSAPAPGLPLIAALGADAAGTRAAVEEGLDRADREAVEILGIAGVVAIPAAVYLAVPTPPGP